MNSKNVLQWFDDYLKARIHFAQQIGDAASRPAQVDFLLKCGALEHLVPLLGDPSVRVQQCAVLAIGRLVNFSFSAARTAIDLQVIPLIISDIHERSKYFKKSAMFTLRGLAKQSSETATLLLNSGVLDAIVTCIEDFDPSVKESAIWAVGCIVKHSVGNAEAAVSAGVLPYLKMALDEPEICVKQIAVSALSDIARQDLTLAQAVVEAGSVPSLAKCVISPSPRLKQVAFCCLGNISKHSEQLAEIVLESDVVSEALLNLGSNSEEVKVAAASLVCDIVKHNCQFSQLVVNSGGMGGLVHMLSTSDKKSVFPAVLALGYISSENEELASAAINEKSVDVLVKVLENSSDESVKAAAVWAIGQMGKHTAAHATLVAGTNALMTILQTYITFEESNDLQQKCKGSLKQIITKCNSMEYLEPLLHVAPIEILKYVIGQLVNVLPTDAKARRTFVTSGSLKRLQEIQAPLGSTILEYINSINSCFPQDIIRYYSPGYPELLLQKVEEFIPEKQIGNLQDIPDPEDDNVSTQNNIPPRASQEHPCL